MKQIEEFKKFWALLPTDVSANLEFARRVANGDVVQQAYFFGDYSIPILKYILIRGLEKSYYEGREREISDDYYCFVSGIDLDNNKLVPTWYQLVSYKGLNNQKLQSWLEHNGRQWFVKRKKADRGGLTGGRMSDEEKKRVRRTHSIDDIIGSFVHRQFAVDADYDAEQEREQILLLLGERMAQLPQRDQKILRVSFDKELKWQQRWQQLQEYMPEYPYHEGDMSAEEKKAVQDRLAILKRNSLDKLKAKMK